MSTINTELTPMENAGFLALQDFDFASAIFEEMEGLNATFERIKIPAGGTTIFEIPGDDPNEPEAVKEFSAVILFHHPLNSYYKDAYTGGSNPPDCGSFDGVTGVGNPGGSSKTCPFYEFGSGENGNAKACKNPCRLAPCKTSPVI